MYILNIRRQKHVWDRRPNRFLNSFWPFKDTTVLETSRWHCVGNSNVRFCSFYVLCMHILNIRRQKEVWDRRPNRFLNSFWHFKHTTVLETSRWHYVGNASVRFCSFYILCMHILNIRRQTHVWDRRPNQLLNSFWPFKDTTVSETSVTTNLVYQNTRPNISKDQNFRQ